MPIALLPLAAKAAPWLLQILGLFKKEKAPAMPPPAPSVSPYVWIAIAGGGFLLIIMIIILIATRPK